MEIFPIRLGITLGIIWGTSIFLLSLFSNKKYGLLIFNSIADIYIGCSQKNLFSKLLCGILGFLDAFIGGILIGTIYNNIKIYK